MATICSSRFAARLSVNVSAVGQQATVGHEALSISNLKIPFPRDCSESSGGSWTCWIRRMKLRAKRRRGSRVASMNLPSPSSLTCSAIQSQASRLGVGPSASVDRLEATDYVSASRSPISGISSDASSVRRVGDMKHGEINLTDIRRTSRRNFASMRRSVVANGKPNDVGSLPRWPTGP